MCEVSIRELGNTQYLVSYIGEFTFRVAVDTGVSYIALADLAECCGYKAGTKFSVRYTLPKVKLSVRHKDGRAVGGSTPAWFLAMDDAILFVKERALDDGFKKRFVGYAKTIRNFPVFVPQNSTTPEPVQPAQEQPKAPVAQPSIGVNSFVSRIDQMIAELVTMKQELSSIR